jgi:hypothetical protein
MLTNTVLRPLILLSPLGCLPCAPGGPVVVPTASPVPVCSRLARGACGGPGRHGWRHTHDHYSRSPDKLLVVTDLRRPPVSASALPAAGNADPAMELIRVE